MKNIDKEENGFYFQRKGIVLVVVLGFVLLMTFSAVMIMTVLRQDIEMVAHVKFIEQARQIAEAGINHAFARVTEERSSAASSGLDGTLDTGSYVVTFSDTFDTANPGMVKCLITSVGTVTAGNISKTVTAEVRFPRPTAMLYQCAAGNNVRIASLLALTSITGDIHANNVVYLKAVIAIVRVTGDVSAWHYVLEGTKLHEQDVGGWFAWLGLDYLVSINGSNLDSGRVYEGDYGDDVSIVTFPNFNYEAYEEAADPASSDHYDSDHTFSNATLTPANGIVYVDGDATFIGDCEIYGGIIADNINIGRRVGGNFTDGTLEQVYTDHNRNVIIARDGDIAIRGEFHAEKALVYATRDIISLENGARINVTGSLLAGRDIYLWSFWTYITYTYAATNPKDLLFVW